MPVFGTPQRYDPRERKLWIRKKSCWKKQDKKNTIKIDDQYIAINAVKCTGQGKQKKI